MGVNGQLHAQAALYPGEGHPGTHWTVGWVSPRAGLDTEARHIADSFRFFMKYDTYARYGLTKEHVACWKRIFDEVSGCRSEVLSLFQSWGPHLTLCYRRADLRIMGQFIATQWRLIKNGGSKLRPLHILNLFSNEDDSLLWYSAM
jgi:hypothetical protein